MTIPGGGIKLERTSKWRSLAWQIVQIAHKLLFSLLQYGRHTNQVELHFRRTIAPSETISPDWLSIVVIDKPEHGTLTCGMTLSNMNSVILLYESQFFGIERAQMCVFSHEIKRAKGLL